MVDTEDASVSVCGESVRPLVIMRSVDLRVVRVRQYLGEDILAIFLYRLFLISLGQDICDPYIDSRYFRA